MKYSIAFASGTVSVYHVMMYAVCDNDVLTPRIQKTKCLDGTVILQDYGAHDADRSLTFAKTLSEAEFSAFKSFMLNVSSQYISTKQGAFSGAISELSPTQIKFEISEKLSA